MKAKKSPNGSRDISSPEHAFEMCRLIPSCELAIFPGGYGVYLGAIESLENGKWAPFKRQVKLKIFLRNTAVKVKSIFNSSYRKRNKIY